MNVSPILAKIPENATAYSSTQYGQRQLNKKFVSFGNIDYAKASIIENKLLKRGIKTNVCGNSFVAECYEKTVNIFEKLLNKSFLPKKLDSDYMQEQIYACYICGDDDTVSVNRHYFESVYKNKSMLAKEARKNHHHLLLTNWLSTRHPAHIFVHEFSHCAHYHHVIKRNGKDVALDTLNGLTNTQIPTSIGKLIIKFKLSGYAVEGNMKEFMAERMSKDICKNLTKKQWQLKRDIDVNYENIFSRKWQYRYSTPQSYIDYFTQQVWNGDIDGANAVGDDTEKYLKELESAKVAPVVEFLFGKKSVLRKIGIGEKIYNYAEARTVKRNMDNRLKLNRPNNFSAQDPMGLKAREHIFLENRKKKQAEEKRLAELRLREEQKPVYMVEQTKEKRINTEFTSQQEQIQQKQQLSSPDLPESVLLYQQLLQRNNNMLKLKL